VKGVCAALALAAFAACAAKPGAADPLDVREVAKGVKHAAFVVKPIGDDPFSGHAFFVDLAAADLHVVPAGSDTSRRPVDQIVATLPSVLAVNASFFDEDGRAMGLAVDDGRLIATHRIDAWGALVVDGKKARVVKGAEVQDELSHRLVLQGIPRLVVKGEVQKLKEQKAERTAVCTADSEVTIVVATAADTTRFAQFLATPRAQGGLGCVDALNLDGGPSTQMYARLPGVQARIAGGWGVPNALVVTPR
jgi:hypothetical protein